MDQSIKTSIISVLKKRLSGAFAWMVPELENLIDTQGGEECKGVLRIGFNHRYGKSYTACTIYPPLVQSVGCMPIPKPYVDVLCRFNGARLHGIDLFGILENESNHRRCMAIDQANMFWIGEFRGLPKDAVYFGGRAFSYDENLGYFYDASLRVVSARKSGEIMKSWPSIEDMLRDEWNVSKRVEVEMCNRLNLPKFSPKKQI
jgi:hypothetical protein